MRAKIIQQSMTISTSIAVERMHQAPLVFIERQMIMSFLMLHSYPTEELRNQKMDDWEEFIYVWSEPLLLGMVDGDPFKRKDIDDRFETHIAKIMDLHIPKLEDYAAGYQNMAVDENTNLDNLL